MPGPRKARRQHQRRPRVTPPPPQLEQELPPPAPPLEPDTVRAAADGSGPADVGEVDQVTAQIQEDTAERAPAPPPPPEVEVHDREGELEDEAARMEERVQAHLTDLTREDIADVLGLAFALIAARRGPHWKLEPETEEARRISLWVHKAVERHGVAWVGKWLPDLMAAGCLVYAVRRRLDKDLELAGDRPPAQPEGGKA